MNLKDFALIAAALKDMREAMPYPESTDTLNMLARDFADRLKATNKQFNRDKFLRACGVAL